MKVAYFLVQLQNRDLSLDREINERFVDYMLKEGFKYEKTYWFCPWYFVDIKEKIFIPGRPGLCYGYVIGEHAITFEEFKTIYDIYKRHGKNKLWVDM